MQHLVAHTLARIVLLAATSVVLSVAGACKARVTPSAPLADEDQAADKAQHFFLPQPGAPSAAELLAALDEIGRLVPVVVADAGRQPPPAAASASESAGALALTDGPDLATQWLHQLHTVRAELAGLRATAGGQGSQPWQQLGRALDVLGRIPAADAATGNPPALGLTDPTPVTAIIADLTSVQTQVSALKAKAEAAMNTLECVAIPGARAPYNYGYKTWNGAVVYSWNLAHESMDWSTCNHNAKYARNGLVCATRGEFRASEIVRLSNGAQVGGNNFGFSFETDERGYRACVSAAAASTRKHVCAGSGTEHSFVYDHTATGRGTMVSDDYGQRYDDCIKAAAARQ